MTDQTQDLGTLNTLFGRAGAVEFVEGQGGFAVARVNNTAARAEICLYGGHVMAYQPHGGKPLLWMSPAAVFQQGRPIRGGIPICWPWFGTMAEPVGHPSHGFVRTRVWTVAEVRHMNADQTLLRFNCTDDDDSHALFPSAFSLTLSVLIGHDLRVELDVSNTGRAALRYTGALHTYLAVSDVRNVSIGGLDKTTYVDTVGGANRRSMQEGPVRFTGETDRIYLATESDCIVEDTAWARRVVVAKTGSRSTVVWNPWSGRAAQLADIGADHFPGFVCVEAANCLDDAIVVPSGSARRLGTRISVLPDAPAARGGA